MSCSFGLSRVLFVNCRQFMYLVNSLLVLRAGCGTWLFQFLIIAYLFTDMSSLVKTEQNCSSMVFALFRLSEKESPSFFKGAIPELSLCWTLRVCIVIFQHAAYILIVCNPAGFLGLFLECLILGLVFR